MRPAIGDITVSSAQVSVTLRFNAELFLADIDASQITDSDDAPTAAIYDDMRQLPPAALRDAFMQKWPTFAALINAQAGGRPCEPQHGRQEDRVNTAARPYVSY